MQPETRRASTTFRLSFSRALPPPLPLPLPVSECVGQPDEQTNPDDGPRLQGARRHADRCANRKAPSRTVRGATRAAAASAGATPGSPPRSSAATPGASPNAPPPRAAPRLTSGRHKRCVALVGRRVWARDISPARSARRRLRRRRCASGRGWRQLQRREAGASLLCKRPLLRRRGAGALGSAIRRMGVSALGVRSCGGGGVNKTTAKGAGKRTPTNPRCP